jgi:bile acid-coenzyme A ligase
LLAERGAGPGTLVAIGLANSPEHLYVAIGAWKAGAGVLPIRADLPDWERERLLQVAQVVLFVGDAGGPGGPVVTADEVRASVDRSTDPLPDVVADPAIAIASSGSTGRPKVIVSPLPGMAVPRGAPPLAAEFFELPEHMPQLVPAPLYHTNGFSLAHTTLFTGDLMVLMEKFDAAQAVDLVERYRITCFAAVPTMLARIARVEGVRERDFSSIVYVMQGGATCPDWVVEAWSDLVGPEHLFMTYGSTERVGLTFMRGVDWVSHRGSCGVGHNTEIRILNDDGNELPPGEVGSVYTSAMPGMPKFEYHNAPEKTAESWRDDEFTVHDLGSLDEDGYLFLADRRVDLILRGGVNIYPAEVEHALATNPDVVDSAVFGLPDEQLGQRVHAIVELRSGAPQDPDVILEQLRGQLAPYKLPTTFEFIDELPREPNGKVLKRQLRDARLPAET